ncbi:hypothetical protein [uncultured Selenomonas sp.]|uniref:hypothetical protein n=1 Tax=uncultured Selenomonas sp. TaxID=159275 RepID=UPI0025FA72E6|nr:hypothetical protein [uncultured Selenomonas sp.]
MKKIIMIAVGVYVAILVIGGAAYFALSEKKAELPPDRPEVLESKDTAEPSEAKRKAEEAKARAEAAEKAAKEQAARAAERDKLVQSLTVEKRSGLTLYTHDYPKKPAPGVYLRPFVVSDGVTYALKFDIYYYYNIDDPQQTAWVHGDALAATVDGQPFHLTFHAKDRRDKMSPDAENLAENYVHDATDDEIALLHAIAQAGSVRITYYQQATGEERSQTLSREDIRKIHDMMAFYDSVAAEQ